MNAPDNARDRTSELLTQALNEEAAMVDTDPGALQAIQQRTSGTSPKPAPRGRTPWIFGALGAGLATAATITAIVLVGGNADDPGRTPAATGSTQEQPTQEQGTEGPSTPPASEQVPTKGTVSQDQMHEGSYDPNSDSNVTMVYLGQPGPTGEVRLYTEPHTVPAGGDTQAVAAVHEFLTSTPIDPDYSSGWPEGVDVTEVTVDGGTTTIALAGDADLGAANGLTDDAATKAIQAIMLVAGDEPRAVFTYNDEPLTTLLGQDVSQPVELMPEEDLRAWISIDSIVEGETVTSPVTVTGSANVYEGNVVWQLLDVDGNTLDEGFMTLASFEWREFTVPLGKLDSGSYTFRAYEESAEDGSVTFLDDKTFTVE